MRSIPMVHFLTKREPSDVKDDQLTSPLGKQNVINVSSKLEFSISRQPVLETTGNLHHTETNQILVNAMFS
jgi:hypothetical protein